MEEKRSRKSRSRDYLNDFKLNDKGKYEYKGIVYHHDLNKADEKQKFTLLLVAIILMDVFVIACGSLPCEFMLSSIYVILPYLFQFLFVILLNSSFFTMYFERNELKKYKYEKSVLRFKPYITVAMIAVIMTMVGEVIYYIIDKTVDSVLLLVCFNIIKIIELIVLRFFMVEANSINWIEDKSKIE